MILEASILVTGILLGLIIASIRFNREIKIMKKKYEDDLLQEKEFQKRMNAINSLKEMKAMTWKKN